MRRMKLGGDKGDCWIWTGAANNRGYGVIQPQRHTTNVRELALVHRASYELDKGAIPAGYEIDHLCRTPRCFNPEHLQAVTPHENNMRSRSTAASNAVKTHCKRGHEFNQSNTYWYRGSRSCVTCRLSYGAQWRATHARDGSVKL